MNRRKLDALFGENAPAGITAEHNDLLIRIGRAKTPDELTVLYFEVKQFVDKYKTVDWGSTNSVFSTFYNKVHTMAVEAERGQQQAQNAADEVRNRSYNFQKEQDDSHWVQNKLLQVMAKLPTAKTDANSGMVDEYLRATIASGTVGSKSVLELLKYPAYAAMVTPWQQS